MLKFYFNSLQEFAHLATTFGNQTKFSRQKVDFGRLKYILVGVGTVFSY
mgnify:CR=1 FL=1